MEGAVYCSGGRRSGHNPKGAVSSTSNEAKQTKPRPWGQTHHGRGFDRRRQQRARRHHKQSDGCSKAKAVGADASQEGP